MQKVMVTIVWGVNGIYIVDFLPYGRSYNSSYFVEHILNRIVETKADIWSESDFKRIWLHLDNCRVHNSKVSIENMKSMVSKELLIQPIHLI